MWFGIFHKSPERIAEEAERSAPDEHVNALRVRHERLLLDAATAGLDPATLVLLIQFFGPLAVALVKLLVARLSRY